MVNDNKVKFKNQARAKSPEELSLREIGPNKDFFCPYFPVFSPNPGKYGLVKTPYLDIFHAVCYI